MLTLPEWLETLTRLRSSPAALHVLYYLRTIDPYGTQELDFRVKDLADVLGYDPSTISRALKKLEKEGYIGLMMVEVTIRILPPKFSEQRTLHTGNAHCVHATPIAPMQRSLSEEKSTYQAQIQAEQAFDENCGKPDFVPITRSDLLERTIGAKHTPEGEQRGELVQPSNPGDDFQSSNLEPPKPIPELLPRDGVTNADPLLERLVVHGIQPNKTVLGVIEALHRNHSAAEVEAIVEKALSSMREQGRVVRNPNGFFVAAIRRGFTANEAKRNSRERKQESTAPPTDAAPSSPLPTKPPPQPNWIQFSIAIDQALLVQDCDFALGRLQQAWLEGWPDKIEELIVLRKRDWPFQITAQGVVYVGE